MSFNSLLLIIHKFVILFIILIILWGVIKQKLHKRQKAGGWGGLGNWFLLMSFNSLLLIILKFVILFIILIILWGVIKQKLYKRRHNRLEESGFKLTNGDFSPHFLSFL